MLIYLRAGSVSTSVPGSAWDRTAVEVLCLLTGAGQVFSRGAD